MKDTTTAQPAAKRSRKMARETDISSEQQHNAAPPAATKISMVLDLLRRVEGASLDEMVQATRWLPHTTRAALTGLKKKGHVINKVKVNDVTRYAIATAAPE